MSRALGNCKRPQADAFEFVIVKYVFGIWGPQLRADSAMKFLKRIIKPAYGSRSGYSSLSGSRPSSPCTRTVYA
jgi:hypothetical protein